MAMLSSVPSPILFVCFVLLNIKATLLILKEVSIPGPLLWQPVPAVGSDSPTPVLCRSSMTEEARPLGMGLPPLDAGQLLKPRHNIPPPPPTDGQMRRVGSESLSQLVLPLPEHLLLGNIVP